MAKLEEVTLTIDGTQYEITIPESIDSDDGTIDLKLMGGVTMAIHNLMTEIINRETVEAQVKTQEEEASSGDNEENQ